MPRETEALAIFTKRGPLTSEEWYRLIEIRREQIGPFLDRFTLPELSSVECLYHEGHFGALGNADIVDGGPEFSLKTQGIFNHEFESRKKTSQARSNRSWHGSDMTPANGKLSIWGLTRKKQWIVAIVTYEGSLGYKERGREDAKRVRIKEVKLPTMVKLSKSNPKKIWLTLGKTFRWFVDQRTSQLKQMQDLADLTVVEEKLSELTITPY